MAEPLARRLRRSAFCYGILALTAVGAFLIVLDTLDWKLGAMAEWLTGYARSIMFDWSLMFTLNAVLAFGAWHFLKLPRAARVVIFSIAVIAPAVAGIGLALDSWRYSHGQAFTGADRSMLVSGLGGRLLLVVGYALVAIPLYNALREPRQPG